MSRKQCICAMAACLACGCVGALIHAAAPQAVGFSLAGVFALAVLS